MATLAVTVLSLGPGPGYYTGKLETMAAGLGPGPSRLGSAASLATLTAGEPPPIHTSIGTDMGQIRTASHSESGYER